ncbi:unnamed protein product [Urochloa decumbens]|uniref:DUF6598 domain-containing protein n=1 Tax=Urochloa decumbens TaxID=240449 RepID=A0ABC8YSE9_9POAL
MLLLWRATISPAQLCCGERNPPHQTPLRPLNPSICSRRFMEEIRCVLEEAYEEPDPKLKIIERVAEEANDGGGEEEEEEDNGGVGGGKEEKEENAVGVEEEETNSAGDGEDSDDDTRGWDEYGDPCLPFIGTWDDQELLRCTAGSNYTLEEAAEAASSGYERNDKLFDEWYEMSKENRTRAVIPLDVLPAITTSCAYGRNCYHTDYRTEDTTETAQTHPYFRPCGMMQVFSLRLSSPADRPINIYGTFAIRDCWEPFRNSLFRRSRDNPTTIPQGCTFLPLCSPSRGMYVLQCILLDIDLWIKEDGDGSADKLLFHGYVELDAQTAVFGSKLQGRLQGDCHGLIMRYTFLRDSIETVIAAVAGGGQSSEIRFSAFISGFDDDEVELYDGAFSGSGIIFRHFMAVSRQEKLHVVLKMNGSQYKWTFQAGVGVVAAPEEPVSLFAPIFTLSVSFRTRGKSAAGWHWSCIHNQVSVTKSKA